MTISPRSYARRALLLTVPILLAVLPFPASAQEIASNCEVRTERGEVVEMGCPPAAPAIPPLRSGYLIDSYAGQRVVTGIVRADLGDPLFGASVIATLSDTLIGTLTDPDGRFVLPLDPGRRPKKLSFHFAGFQTVEVSSLPPGDSLALQTWMSAGAIICHPPNIQADVEPMLDPGAQWLERTWPEGVSVTLADDSLSVTRLLDEQPTARPALPKGNYVVRAKVKDWEAECQPGSSGVSWPGGERTVRFSLRGGGS